MKIEKTQETIIKYTAKLTFNELFQLGVETFARSLNKDAGDVGFEGFVDNEMVLLADKIAATYTYTVNKVESSEREVESLDSVAILRTYELSADYPDFRDDDLKAGDKVRIVYRNQRDPNICTVTKSALSDKLLIGSVYAHFLTFDECKVPEITFHLGVKSIELLARSSEPEQAVPNEAVEAEKQQAQSWGLSADKPSINDFDHGLKVRDTVSCFCKAGKFLYDREVLRIGSDGHAEFWGTKRTRWPAVAKIVLLDSSKRPANSSEPT